MTISFQVTKEINDVERGLKNINDEMEGSPSVHFQWEEAATPHHLQEKDTH